MSKLVHPLFLTRGVPWTHDVSLINDVISRLKKTFSKSFNSKFDKSIDDRLKKSNGLKLNKNPI